MRQSGKYCLVGPKNGLDQCPINGGRGNIDVAKFLAILPLSIILQMGNRRGIDFEMR